MTGRRLSDAEFGRRVLALVADHDAAEKHAQKQAARESRDRLLRIAAEVFVFLAANPTAKANDVDRAVTGRRPDVLQAVKAFRAAQNGTQTPGNRLPAEASDPDVAPATHVNVKEVGS